MLKKSLIFIYERDLQKVIEEIKLYKNEADLWLLDNKITNSGGNLALHLIGNINHFFGTILGGTNYERERDLEFSRKEVSSAEIIEQLESTINMLKDSLNNLSDEDFNQDFPQEFNGEKQKTVFVALSLLSHLNYHLGQINYHRRLLSK